MKAIFLEKRGLKVKETPIPKIRDNEVLVKIKFASVCGSDYAHINYEKDVSHLIGNIIGHEGCGYVIKTGSKVKHLKINDYVGIESHRATKEWLKAGKNPYKDPNSAVIGYRPFPDGKLPQGVWAEYIAVPEVYANKIPEIEEYPGSLWEPFGNGVRLFQTIKPFITADSKIAVSGCGFQGVQIMFILRYYYNIKNIFAVDISKERLRFVKNNITENTFLPEELPEHGYEIWLEMSGSGHALNQALRLTRDHLILFGLPKSQVRIGKYKVTDFIFNSINEKINNINVHGVFGRFKEDWDLSNKIIPEIAEHLKKLWKLYGPINKLPEMANQGFFKNLKADFFKAVFTAFQ